MAWMAATSPSAEIRSLLINAVGKYYRQSGNTFRGDLITADGGWSIGYETRPVDGGVYALLALDVMDQIRLRDRIAAAAVMEQVNAFVQQTRSGSPSHQRQRRRRRHGTNASRARSASRRA